MSDATKAAMEEAIAAHFADEMEDSIMTDYVCTVQGSSMRPERQGMNTLYRAIPDNQSMMTTLGLVEYARIYFMTALQSNWRDL